MPTHYLIVLASYVLCGEHVAERGILPGAIPGTMSRIQELSPHTGLGGNIWRGYLDMMDTNGPGSGMDPAARYAIRQPADAPEIERFREALNLFERFMAGEGRDNCRQVFSIAVRPEPVRAPAVSS